jgi:hypothetical protein
MILADLDVSIATGTFDRRSDRHLSRTDFRVDERAWREMGEIADRALDETLAVQASGAERLRESGEDGIEGCAVQLVFEMPPSKGESS